MQNSDRSCGVIGARTEGLIPVVQSKQRSVLGGQRSVEIEFRVENLRSVS